MLGSGTLLSLEFGTVVHELTERQESDQLTDIPESRAIQQFTVRVTTLQAWMRYIILP